MRISAVVDHVPVALLPPMGEEREGEDEMKEGGAKEMEERERKVGRVEGNTAS